MSLCVKTRACTNMQGYMRAMHRGLYDLVSVHGPQGEAGPMKAYACTNPMEFFAELSVAYLWKQHSLSLESTSSFSSATSSSLEVVDKSLPDTANEFNKWFPHNCCQLQQHDDDTFLLLDMLWSEGRGLSGEDDDDDDEEMEGGKGEGVGEDNFKAIGNVAVGDDDGNQKISTNGRG